jgi:diphthamide biosynthesis enzyme Dph1/Dph2-like protein
MKTLFIEARRKLKLDREKLKELESQLPDTIYLAYSIQYKELAEEVRKNIKKKVIGFSQVLGCSLLKTDCPILLIGSGRFHALNIAFSSGKRSKTAGKNKKDEAGEVWIFDNLSISKISQEEIGEYEKKQKGKYIRFLSSDSVGILVSVKHGQNNIALALKIKDNLEEKNKEAVIFLSDNVNLQELENFPMDIWINTACPGISLDSPRIINFRDANLSIL